MKKIFFCLFLSLCSLPGYTQFILTNQGMRDDLHPDKDYVVLPCAGKSQEVLYNETKKFITINYVSAKDVLSESFPDVLSVLGKSYIYFNFGMGVRRECSLSYKVNTYFKDDRIKIEFFVVDISFAGNSIPLISANGIVGVYKKNGQLRDEVSKKAIENTANRFVLGLMQYLDGSSNNQNDNW